MDFEDFPKGWGTVFRGILDPMSTEKKIFSTNLDQMIYEEWI
jgi:hypothetical protein